MRPIDKLVEEEIAEGLFVEYKSEWQSPKVARAVASFANNSGGGTLIVGIKADNLTPTMVVGIDNRGDLEERLVQIVRSTGQ